MAKVFVSYAREDAETARQLAEAVAAAGHDVWWDRQIQGGSRFATEIDPRFVAMLTATRERLGLPA
ncbi:MAG: toll/interleukin-1 receptor domain-containing protein [Sphingomicrobium sp.]